MWLVSKIPPPACSSNPSEYCAAWAWNYLGDCLCNTKDAVALSIGLVSVISWGVAEVPQIITNYREQSTEGLSIAFLMTWIVGDLFNLTGCWLEPATLPTQFYMALLYTVTTVVLTTQTVYYGHIRHRLKANKISLPHKSCETHEEDAQTKEKLYRIDEKEAAESILFKERRHAPSSPIPVSASGISRQSSAGRDLYYKSARSLSKSPVPAGRASIATSRDSGRTPPSFLHDQHPSREPLLARISPVQSAPSLTTKNMLCVASSASFLFCTYNLHSSLNPSLEESAPGMVIMVGRKLLQSEGVGLSMGYGSGGSQIGSYLGWAMAAIYMGGRLPQICLNIRRGNVEGLSPLMFMFALIGNATYVGSILVKSLDWSRIKPNMPWLVDAGGCVLLDAFILIQFVYFCYWKTEDVENRDDL